MISLDSNISDELFAAYIDGNTTPLENSLIEKAMLQDDSLNLAKGIVSSAINIHEDFDDVYHDEDYSLADSISFRTLDPISVLDDEGNEIIGALDVEEDDPFRHSEDGEEDDFDNQIDSKEDI